MAKIFFGDSTVDVPRYDFPQRVATVTSAEAEVRRLGRSLGTATLRRDAAAVRYLARRVSRARSALWVLRGRPTFAHRRWTDDDNA